MTYWKPEEVATEFQVNVRTIYDEIARGKLRAVRVGRQYRVPAEAIEEYLFDSWVTPTGTCK